MISELLIAALILVESSGNDTAIGADGLSYGPLQITDIYREDVNRIAGTNFTRKDCFDRAKSIEMFLVYMAHYATRERLGHEPTDEDIARIHNGGPDGWRRRHATDHYWSKVRKALEAMRHG